MLQHHFSGLIGWEEKTEASRAVQPRLRALRKRGMSKLADEMERRFNMVWGVYPKSTALVDESLKHIPGVRQIAQPFALDRWLNRTQKITNFALLSSLGFQIQNSFQLIQTTWPVSTEGQFWGGIRDFYSKEKRHVR